METRGRDYVTDEQGRVRIKRQFDSALLTRPFVARFHQCSGRPKLTRLIFTSNIEERVVSRVDSRRRSSLTSILLINSPSLERSIDRDALATSLPAKTRFNRLNIYRGHPISSTCYPIERPIFSFPATVRPLCKSQPFHRRRISRSVASSRLRAQLAVHSSNVTLSASKKYAFSVPRRQTRLP